MKKNKNNIVFFVVLFFIIIAIVVKDKIILKNNEYIVSSEEVNYTESTLIKEEKLNDVKEEHDISKDDNEMITIYISGQVKNVGLITIKKDARLGDAIELAGGVKENADLNKVNMALKVKDEYHYIVPKIGEELGDESLVSGNDNLNDFSNDGENEKKININLATINDLDELPGVGEATANKIIKYRDENGKFNSVEEIKNVNGIGDKKYEDIKDLISIN